MAEVSRLDEGSQAPPDSLTLEALMAPPKVWTVRTQGGYTALYMGGRELALYVAEIMQAVEVWEWTLDPAERKAERIWAKERATAPSP